MPRVSRLPCRGRSYGLRAIKWVATPYAVGYEPAGGGRSAPGPTCRLGDTKRPRTTQANPAAVVAENRLPGQVVRTGSFVTVRDVDELSDAAWAKLAPHLAGRAGAVGRTGDDNRLFPNAAVLWVARHGCAWRALPARFGKHDPVRKRSRRWALTGVGTRLFAAVQAPDLDWALLDSTVVRAHAQAAGSRKKGGAGTRPSVAAAADCDRSCTH